MSATKTWAPAAASTPAIASPIPVAAPVTRATLPSRERRLAIDSSMGGAYRRKVAAMSDKRIEIAKKLFAGWSSGDPDAPRDLITQDAVLHDIASGTFEGWPAIRAFFASGLARWDDLQLLPDEFWANDSGLAVHYVMSATVKDPASYGAEHVGKKWSVEVMSYLRFDGDRVCFEADFHDKGSRARSLGIT